MERLPRSTTIPLVVGCQAGYLSLVAARKLALVLKNETTNYIRATRTVHTNLLHECKQFSKEARLHTLHQGSAARCLCQRLIVSFSGRLISTITSSGLRSSLSTQLEVPGPLYNVPQRPCKCRRSRFPNNQPCSGSVRNVKVLLRAISPPGHATQPFSTHGPLSAIMKPVSYCLPCQAHDFKARSTIENNKHNDREGKER